MKGLFSVWRGKHRRELLLATKWGLLIPAVSQALHLARRAGTLTVPTVGADSGPFAVQERGFSAEMN